MEFLMADQTTAIIKNVKDINLSHTFLCGQCFRWVEEEDGSFLGVAHSRVVRMKLLGNDLVIENTNQDDVKNIWIKYLDLERDYGKIKSRFKNDKFVSKAMDFGYGIHILNQDMFECLISFIISTQNQIPRIKKIVGELSRAYGTKCMLGDKVHYAFPTVEQLSGITEEELAFLKAGYRAGYIVDAVKMVLSGKTNLDKIKSLPYEDAKKELMKIRGVGPKVADCVLLFSMEKSQAFPVDVWVQRTMRSLYLDPKASNKIISQKANEIFGEYAGFAQQYLFYFSRENGGFEK